MGSAIVPLERAFSNHSAVYYRLSATCNANFDWGFLPQISHFWRPRPLSNSVILVATQLFFLLNVFSFYPKVLAGYTSVTDRHRHADGRTTVASDSVTVTDTFSDAAYKL